MQVILDSNIKATKQPIHGFNIGIGYTIDLSLVESGSRTYQHCFRENGVEPVTIDWGDGTVETLIPQSLENSPTHTYKQEDGDRFDIKITGESIPLSFSYYASTDTKQAVVDIWCLNYHVSNLNGCASMFSSYENLEHVDSRWFEINKMSAVNDGYCLFKDTKVTDIPDEIFQHASSTNYQSTFENTKINTPPPYPKPRNLFIPHI